MNILLGVTGSVATVKLDKLYASLSKLGEVKIVATKAGSYFIGQSGSRLPVLHDADEWTEHFKLGDSVLHIDLRRWADCLVIAPLSANTLAKISYGLCDNLLTCVYRAWDFDKPVVVAPAMNTYMWNSPITDDHLGRIRKSGVIVVDPVSKKLACNDVGVGAMEHADNIAEIIKNKVMRWKPPILNSVVPVGRHPGAFGYVRKFDTHTGVDLYTIDGDAVYAVEDGVVVDRNWFTGANVNMPWWEDTEAITVEGVSGVVLYGEVTPLVNVGDSVKAGDLIAHVKRVLPEHKRRNDIPHHSTSMLHVELYDHGYRGSWAVWNENKPSELCDPTPFLMNAAKKWNGQVHYRVITI